MVLAGAIRMMKADSLENTARNAPHALEDVLSSRTVFNVKCTKQDHSMGNLAAQIVLYLLQLKF